MVGCFELGVTPSIRVGVAIMFAVFIAVVWKINLTRMSLLARAALVFYTMPFFATVGYLFNDDYYWWETPYAIQYQQDVEIISTMIAFGLLGLIGLVSGLLLAKAIKYQKTYNGNNKYSYGRLTSFIYVLLLMLAYIFSWIGAPPETIFVAKYAEEQSVSIANAANFNASFLVSYALLILLFVDAQREQRISRRRLKLLGFYMVTIAIVVFHQLLRGDRESLGLVMGVFALYLTSHAYHPKNGRTDMNLSRQYMLFSVIGVAVFTVFLATGAVRSKLGSVPLFSVETLYEGYLNNTWTAVLLTDLSLAAMHVRGEILFEYGSTYLDYFLSLPPGFITKLLNYTRPLEVFQGPAHIFIKDISAGGIHLPIVPFLNFGALGVVLILSFYGFIIGRIELLGGSENPQPFWRFIYGAFFVFLPFWMWYGDMYAIRGVMAVILCWWFYRLLIAISRQLSTYRYPYIGKNAFSHGGTETRRKRED